MTQSEVKFFSVNKFMNDLNAKSEHVEFVHLYFIPSQFFRNQFNQISIRPVAMVLKNKDEKAKSMKYEDMKQFLGYIPIVSFKQSNDRRIYKNQRMQKLIIHNELHKKDGIFIDDSGKAYDIEYYDSKILTVNDENVIVSIKANIPEFKHKYNDDVELFDC